MKYEWRREGSRWVLGGGDYGNIAWIDPRSKSEVPAGWRGSYRAVYTWGGGGNSEGSRWAVLRSTRAAKIWVERELAKFWEPPEIAK